MINYKQLYYNYFTVAILAQAYTMQYSLNTEQINYIMDTFETIMNKEQTKNNNRKSIVLFCNPTHYNKKWNIEGRKCYYYKICNQKAVGYIIKNSTAIRHCCPKCALEKSHTSKVFYSDRMFKK